MSLIDSGTFLPGVITEVESDYSFGYDTSAFGTTESMIVIGTAFSGPTAQPVQVYSPEHARYIFGGTFDSATKREATLVANIEDAYQRGARTIYAVRVGGQEISKEFEFNNDSLLKLRVSGAYPTNKAKDFFLTYDDTEGSESFKIFKPAEQATIVQKKSGMVESQNSVLVLEIKINQDYGFTKDSLLVDVIDAINSHAYNNVLRLGIVDQEGHDVTRSSIDAKTLPLGAMFPGAYMIGRDKVADGLVVDTEVKFKLIHEGAVKPYESFDGMVYRQLVMNTDLNSGFPIYHEDNRVFAQQLQQVGIFSTKPFDFLETAGLVDRAFVKDSNDYEEVDLSKFELYKRLGSGYAVTARLERREDANGNELPPRVKETPISDENRIMELKDGVYSMLENLIAKYRVMSAANADDKITGRLPRAKDFQVAQAVSLEILQGLVVATPIVDKNDLTSPKKYEITVDHLTSDIETLTADPALLFDTAVIPSYAKLPDGEVPVVKDGTTLAVEVNGKVKLYYYLDGVGYEKQNAGIEVNNKFYIVLEEQLYVRAAMDKEFVRADAADIATDFEKKAYCLIQSNGTIYAATLVPGTTNASGAAIDIDPLGDIETMFSDNEDQTTVFAQSNYFEVNNILIRSALLDSITLEEFVEILNNHKALSRVFTFEIARDGLIYKDDYVTEIPAVGTIPATYSAVNLSTGNLQEDRIFTYDYNRYVPYKTTDNFARQLAQHCTYTSLKTASAHGVIGMTPLSNTTVSGISDHIEKLLEKDFDLYAKTASGRNLLDRNNLPYSIGKKLSITAMQYDVVLDSGYVYLSNGSAGYAGMVSNLPLEQSSTNQPINLPSVAFDLTNHQLTRLTQKGYITVKNSYTRGFVITDGITFEKSDSPFRRLNVSRIGDAIEELIREASEPYIGKQNNLTNRNSLQTAIRSNLEKIVGVLIEAYEFNMVVDPTIMKFAYIDIDYSIVPIYEIREIRNRIKVKDQL